MRNAILIITLVNTLLITLACETNKNATNQDITQEKSEPVTVRMESEDLLRDRNFDIEKFLSCQEVHYSDLKFMESDSDIEYTECQFLVSWDTLRMGVQYGKVSVYPEYDVIRYKFKR